MFVFLITFQFRVVSNLSLLFCVSFFFCTAYLSQMTKFTLFQVLTFIFFVTFNLFVGLFVCHFLEGGDIIKINIKMSPAFEGGGGLNDYP